jgi:tetratricopeptide (TPR) repeat protein
VEFGPGGSNDNAGAALLESERKLASRLADVLAKLCETPEIEPRFFYLTGFCLLKAGRPSEVRGWMVRALDAAARHVDTWNVTNARTSARVAAEVGRVAASLRDDELLDRASSTYVAFRQAATFVEKGPTSVSLDPARNPVFLWARRLITMGRLRDVFKLLTGQAGEIFPHLAGALATDFKAAATVGKFVAAVEPDLSTAAHHLALAAFLIQVYATEEAAAAHLQRVSGRFPSHSGLHVELTRLLARLRQWDAAFRAAQAGVDGSAPDDPARERLVLFAARLAVVAGQPKAAKPLLDAAVRRTPARVSHWAEAYAAAGDRDTAFRLYEKAAADGETPNFQLATYHRLNGDAETALRHYNRHIRNGSRTAAWPTGEELILNVDDFNVPAEQARLEILEKLGPDFFIDRLVSKHAGAVTADDDAQIAKLLARLERGTAEERMAAREALLKLDPRVAPALKKGLESKDDWAKIIVREILTEWAEPR